MASLSSTAGKACAECGMPEPCLHSIDADFPHQQEKHIWPVEKPARFTLLDDGSGAEGTITVTSKCSKSGCPKAKLNKVEQNTSVSLRSDGSPNKVILTYKGHNNEMDILGALDSPWEYLSNITTPVDIFDQPASYVVETEGCHEKGTPVMIDAYPTFEIRFTAGVEYTLASDIRQRTVKERRDEKNASRKTMEGAKPKNKGRLRREWNYQTEKFELTRKTEIGVEFGIKICDKDFSKEYAKEITSSKRIRSLEQLNRIDALINNINTYCAPDPESKGHTREYHVFSMALSPVKLEVSYAYQNISTADGPCHFMGLTGEPFLSGTFKFDIIQFICAYCKIDALVAKCREYLEKHGTSVECYLAFTPEITINLGAVYSQNDDKWEFNIPEGNQLKLGIEGVVSAAFKAEVFFAEISLGTEGAISTAAGFELDQHDDGLDLAAFHDGIMGRFEFVADVEYSDKNQMDDININNDIKKEWQLADPLGASESPLRINLYGKIKNIAEPTVTTAIYHQPWAMGTNPNWGK